MGRLRKVVEALDDRPRFRTQARCQARVAAAGKERLQFLCRLADLLCDRDLLLDGNERGSRNIETAGLRRVRSSYGECSHGPQANDVPTGTRR